MPAIPVVAAATLPDIVRRLTEVAGLLAAMLYALGVLRITGELRELHLSAPTILSGFAHPDVLMKGIGVLVSQLSTTVVMLGALAVFASRSTLDGLNRLLLDERALRWWELALAAIAGIGLVLASRWWEGATYVAIVLVLLAWLEIRNRPATRALAIGVMLLGLLFVGVFGSYLHPPPLMHVTVEREDATALQGLLVGKGTDGEWYVATGTGDDEELEVVGGSSAKASRVAIEPADDRDYRTLYYQLTDGWR
jgi:hypothetical protein